MDCRSSSYKVFPFFVHRNCMRFNDLIYGARLSLEKQKFDSLQSLHFYAVTFSTFYWLHVRVQCIAVSLLTLIVSPPDLHESLCALLVPLVLLSRRCCRWALQPCPLHPPHAHSKSTHFIHLCVFAHPALMFDRVGLLIFMFYCRRFRAICLHLKPSVSSDVPRWLGLPEVRRYGKINWGTGSIGSLLTVSPCRLANYQPRWLSTFVVICFKNHHVITYVCYNLYHLVRSSRSLNKYMGVGSGGGEKPGHLHTPPARTRASTSVCFFDV